MAEPVEMQFGMLNPVGPENMYYTWRMCLHMNGHFSEEGVEPVEKHCKT